MFPERLDYPSNHPHWTEIDIFKNPMKLIHGMCELDYRVGMHIQDFYEINIVLRGHGMHYIGEKKVPAHVGDVFIIPPQISHGYEGGRGFDVYHFLISARYFEKYSADLQLLPTFSLLFELEPIMREYTDAKLHLKLEQDEYDQLLPWLKSLEVHARSATTDNMLICNGEALVIITKLCVFYKRNLTGEAVQEEQNRNFFESLAYIHEQYSQKLSIDDLAKRARMSRNSYIHKFKHTTGTSPGEFITRYRMSVAKTMLTETTASVSDIAHAIGFYDASHFIREFHKRMGMSPTEFRKSH